MLPTIAQSIDERIQRKLNVARNQYPGLCYKCCLTVAPGTGHFERHAGGWRVKHGIYPGDGRVTCAEAKANALIQAEKEHELR